MNKETIELIIDDIKQKWGNLDVCDKSFDMFVIVIVQLFMTCIIGAAFRSGTIVSIGFGIATFEGICIGVYILKNIYFNYINGLKKKKNEHYTMVK